MSYYIYKICCDDLPEFIYVGSTKAFRERKRRHRLNTLNGSPEKLYNTMRDNGGWDNWRMVILEDIGEVSLTQARIKEEEHRVKLNANMNSIKCYQTDEEYNERHRKQANNYYKENKEKVLETTKIYREKNKDKIMEWKNQRITCECGRTFRIDGKSEHEKTKIHKKLIEEK